MTWTAPDVVREPGPWTGGERALLEWFLDFHRLTLLHKCAGLTAEQLAARPAEPSILSLADLVRHMTEVERGWFRRGFARQPAKPVYCGPRLADPVLPPFLPGEVLLHEIFKTGAADEMIQAPPGGDVADDQHPLPVPAQRQVTEEAADAPDGLPPALPAR